MPTNENQHLGQSSALYSPKPQAQAETLFLLSISQDEDDAAALRADLKRSGLADYKIQRCLHLDDAIHLLQVCGFDLAFVRLDDFQDAQAAINLLLQTDPHLAIIGLVASRTLQDEGYSLPNGLNAHCRLEDLSPSLVGGLATNVIEQKRSQQERMRLAQELNFALNVGELGSWTLDIETGRINLSESAGKQLNLPTSSHCKILDDLLELVYIHDQEELKLQLDHVIENQGDMESTFRLGGNFIKQPKLKITAKFRPGGPRENPLLYGYIRQEVQTTDHLQKQIESANQAIQKALELRDEAIETASKEMKVLMQKVDLLESASSEPPEQTPKEKESEAEPQVAQPKPTVRAEPTAEPEAGKKKPELDEQRPANESLGIDKSEVFKNVMKTIARNQEQKPKDDYPFDFSSEDQSVYSEPNPQYHGFFEASRKLIEITRKNHDLKIEFAFEEDEPIELEEERDLIFDILKELLTNVVKHSQATECIIALFRDDDDWVLQVEDDGVGLQHNLVSITNPLNKIGLFQIRTKLALKGGQLDLTPTFPKGLIARVRLPVVLINKDAERA